MNTINLIIINIFVLLSIKIILNYKILNKTNNNLKGSNLLNNSYENNDYIPVIYYISSLNSLIFLDNNKLIIVKKTWNPNYIMIKTVYSINTVIENINLLTKITIDYYNRLDNESYIYISEVDDEYLKFQCNLLVGINYFTNISDCNIELFILSYIYNDTIYIDNQIYYPEYVYRYYSDINYKMDHIEPYTISVDKKDIYYIKRKYVRNIDVLELFSASYISNSSISEINWNSEFYYSTRSYFNNITNLKTVNGYYTYTSLDNSDNPIIYKASEWYEPYITLPLPFINRSDFIRNYSVISENMESSYDNLFEIMVSNHRGESIEPEQIIFTGEKTLYYEGVSKSFMDEYGNEVQGNYEGYFYMQNYFVIIKQQSVGIGKINQFVLYYPINNTDSVVFSSNSYDINKSYMELNSGEYSTCPSRFLYSYIFLYLVKLIEYVIDIYVVF